MTSFNGRFPAVRPLVFSEGQNWEAEEMQQMNNLAQDGAPSAPFGRQRGAPEGIVVVDLSLRPLAFDSGGEAILNQFNGAQPRRLSVDRLPSELEQKLRASAPAELSASAEWVSGGGGEYQWRVFFMKPQNGSINQPLLAIHIKREHSLPDAVRRVCREYHLTAREEETLFGIATGLTTRQVAARMNISPNTVNAFLRLIMVKMGVTTRAGVLGRLLDTGGSPVEAA